MRAVALGALVAVLAGCGGTTGLDGAGVFRRDCSECHTVTGHDGRTVGGDLAIGYLALPVLVTFVREMPVRLTRHDIAVVTAYVHAAQQRQRAR
jgi:hypothetical protein